MADPFPAALLAKVHPGVNTTEFFKRTNAARDLVRSETWVTLTGLHEAPLARPTFMSIEYMRVPDGGGAAYTEVEQLWGKIQRSRPPGSSTGVGARAVRECRAGPAPSRPRENRAR